jgi:Flp pilus assembly protein TadG
MTRSDDGQATVELVALLPLLAALAVGGWQVAVAGHAIWSASAAARAASRVAAIGGDAGEAARRVAGRRATLRDAGGGAVRVTVPIPAVTGGADLASFSTTARFEPQR